MMELVGGVVGGVGSVSLFAAVFTIGFIFGCLCCPCCTFCLLCRRKCCPCFSEKRICCGPYSEGTCKYHHVLALLVIQLLRLHVGDSIPTPIVEKPPV